MLTLLIMVYMVINIYNLLGLPLMFFTQFHLERKRQFSFHDTLIKQNIISCSKIFASDGNISVCRTQYDDLLKYRYP